MSDLINKPNHYTYSSIESIEYFKNISTKEEFIGWLRGSIHKYLHRYKYKNGVEDLKKAEFYLKILIDNEEKMK